MRVVRSWCDQYRHKRRKSVPVNLSRQKHLLSSTTIAVGIAERKGQPNCPTQHAAPHYCCCLLTMNLAMIIIQRIPNFLDNFGKAVMSNSIKPYQKCTLLMRKIPPQKLFHNKQRPHTSVAIKSKTGTADGRYQLELTSIPNISNKFLYQISSFCISIGRKLLLLLLDYGLIRGCGMKGRWPWCGRSRLIYPRRGRSLWGGGRRRKEV